LDGVQRYVKFYGDPAQAHGEHLANELYRQLGLEAPETAVFEYNGQWALASTIIPNNGTLGALGLTKKYATRALDGFAADVLTANWDAVGLNLDNMIVLNSGKIARIDQGGAFLMRAQAGRKDVALLEQISEWTAFNNPSVNPAYAKLWQTAGLTGPAEIANKVATQIKAIKKLETHLGGWRGYVEAALPNLGKVDRDQIISMLEKRTGLLGAERKKLEALVKATRAQNKAAKQAAQQLAAQVNQRNVFEYKDAAAWVKQLEAHQYDRAWLKKEFEDLYDVPDPLGGAQINNMPAGRVRLYEGISKFTSGYKDSQYQRELYQSWLKIKVKGSAPDLLNPVDYAVAYSLRTRAARWAKLAAKIGLPGTPTHIRAYRGSRDALFVEDVLAGWFSGKPTMQVRQYAAASWGMTEKAAESFAGQSLSAVFKHEFALEDTFADQLLDDSTFVTVYMHEAEVIGAVDAAGEMHVAVNDQTLYIGGKKYGFANRNAALTAYRQGYNNNFDPAAPRPAIQKTP
jgi:hypothetical protein